MPTIDTGAVAKELGKLAEKFSFQIVWVDGKFVVQVFDAAIATKCGTGSHKRFSVAYQIAVNNFFGSG